MSKYKMFRKDNPYSFILAMILGVVLAVGGSVWATSIGTNVSVTGTLTVSSGTASSTVTRALGVGTSTPAMMLSVGGGGGTNTGHIYLTGGLGVGIATTTAGGIEVIGNVLFGDASGDLAMFNAASLIYNNAGTTTIPSANAASWAMATSSANIPFLRFDTSNYRIGIGTTSPASTFSIGGDGNLFMLGSVIYGNAGTTTIPSSSATSWSYATTTSGAFVRFNTSNTRVGISSSTPGATLAVGGDGTAIIMGAATSSLSIQSTGGVVGGCIELESANGGGTVFRLYATSSGVPAVWESGSCR